MPAPATAAAFLDVCRKSGVVDESALSKVHAETPVAAAKALLRAGALTKFQAGQLLAGKHRGLRFDRLKILDKIGSGGMGTVFLCEHLGLQKRVAVKVLPPEQAGDEGTRERFFREARAAAALDHPNIVRVHDSASSGGIHYIVMEYIQGHDLQTMVNKYGPLPHRRACTYIAQAALGLQHAHEKGLVHRDVKPANLLVDQDGVVKILDLGLARFNDPAKDGLTAKYDNGAILGTADYMAPEQIVASSAVDIRADIYSLGVTLYAIINGKPPFGGSCTQKMMGHTSLTAVSLTTVRREVPKGLSAVVEKMMAKDPEDRYATPGDVVDALSPWLEMDTIPLDSQKTRRIVGAKSGRRKPAKRKSRLPLVAGLAAAALVFGGVGVWLATGSTKQQQANASLPPGMAAVAAPSDQGPPKPAKPVAPPKPSAPKSHYAIDFASTAPFKATFADRQLTEMTGEYPKGWTAQSWREGAAGTVGVEDHQGRKAVVMRTDTGEAGSVELHTDHRDVPFRLTAGRRYAFRIDYALAGDAGGRFEVRFDDEGSPAKNRLHVHPSGGGWQSAEMIVTAPEHGHVSAYFSQFGIAPTFLAVRGLTVTALSDDPPPSDGKELYRLDLAGHADVRRWVGAESGGGDLPDGFNVHTWTDGTVAEAAVATLDGGKALTLRTRSGQPTAMLFGPHFPVAADHDYRITLEYRLPGSEPAELKVDDSGVRGRALCPLPPTGDAWSTVTTTFRAGNPRTAKMEIGHWNKETLAVRTIRVHDLGAPSRATTELYRLDPAKLGKYRVKKRNTETLEEEGTIPDGFQTFAWDGQTVMSFAVSDGELRIENLEGKPSAMVFLPDVKAEKGAVNWLRLEYKCGAPSAGMVRLVAPGGKVRDIGELPGTNNQWQVRHIHYRLTGGERDSVRLEIHARQDRGPLHIRGAVVTQEVAGDPVAATSYRLDLSDAKPFARRYREASVIESQGEGDWPRPWAARTDDAATKGDAFIDTVAGSPAIGLRNDVGPATTRVFTATPVLPLKRGKRYTLKVTYHTETNGNGTVSAGVGGKEVGTLALATASTWTTAETILTPASDGGLTLSIACGTVGSEASVFVRSLEVTPVD